MTVVFEDGACTATLLPDGPTLGVIEIVPKKTVATLAELSADESEHLFWVASFAATALFEGLGAHGTNIVCEEGDNVVVRVVARMQDDGIDMFWEPSEGAKAAIDQTASKVKEALWYVGKDVEETPSSAPAAPVSAPEPDVSPEDNYKLRQLQRNLR